MTDKTSETKSAICGDGMCPYVPCAKYPKCKHGQDYLILKTPYSTQFIKDSVGKAEDKSDKVRHGSLSAPSSAPKSELKEKCTKCKKTKNIYEFPKAKSRKTGYRPECKKCLNEWRLKWRIKTNRYKKINTYNHEYYASHKNMKQAHRDFWGLVDRGIIIKQPCCICGSKRGQAHHPNYEQPFNVIWLCAGCHKELHLND